MCMSNQHILLRPFSEAPKGCIVARGIHRLIGRLFSRKIFSDSRAKGNVCLLRGHLVDTRGHGVTAAFMYCEGGMLRQQFQKVEAPILLSTRGRIDLRTPDKPLPGPQCVNCRSRDPEGLNVPLGGGTTRSCRRGEGQVLPEYEPV